MKCAAMSALRRRSYFPPAATKSGAARTAERLGIKSDLPFLTICLALSPIRGGCGEFIRWSDRHRQSEFLLATDRSVWYHMTTFDATVTNGWSLRRMSFEIARIRVRRCGGKE